MKKPTVKISIKNYGDITLELYPDKAPKTVENFLKLVNSDFYTGLIFHRVIAGFMIQGGGMNESLEPKHTDSIIGEFTANGFSQNDISHKRGVISMARTNEPNSASSQFFIMHNDSLFLDGQYAAFGMTTDGFDVIDKIAATQTSSVYWYDDVPVEPIIIEKIVEL